MDNRTARLATVNRTVALLTTLLVEKQEALRELVLFGNTDSGKRIVERKAAAIRKDIASVEKRLGIAERLQERILGGETNLPEGSGEQCAGC